MWGIKRERSSKRWEKRDGQDEMTGGTRQADEGFFGGESLPYVGGVAAVVVVLVGCRSDVGRSID